MKAVLCPVCNGVGRVSAGFYNRSGDCLYWVSSGGTEECRSCQGRGWLEVNDSPPGWIITVSGLEMTNLQPQINLPTPLERNGYELTY